MAGHFHHLTVSDIRRETDTCISVAFEIPSALKEIFTYSHGQNITVKATVGDEILRRSYSICSSPLQDELRIAIKKVHSGKFSSWIHDQLKPGDKLDVLPPSGKFYTRLDPAKQKNYIAFAAGSGITPILSIIKTTLATETCSRFTLFYGNRDRAAIIFREELEGLKNSYIDRLSIHHILSRETTESEIYQGRIDEKKCEAIFLKLENISNTDDFFICGPEAMIFAVKNFLEKKAVDPRAIHFELFTIPGAKRPDQTLEKINEPSPATKLSAVSIRLDGLQSDINIPYSGASILDAALKAGNDLPFACKGGVCATCRAKLISGEVFMDNNYALEPEELTNGYILTCQSHPRSEAIIIDFDSK